MIRTACWVLAICAIAVPPARADWRDDCPAGYNKSRYQRDPRLGAAAETESALTQARVLGGLDPSYHTAHGNFPRSTTYDAFFHLQERPWRGLTVGLTGSYLYHLEGAARTGWPGAFVGSVGWRHDFEGDDPADQAATTQGGSLRRGLVVQAIGGLGSSDPADPDGYRRQAALRPFDGYLLASSVAGVMAEYRIEQVGCRAVFVHLRGGVLATGFPAGAAAPSGTAVELPALIAPATFAAGAYASDNAAVIVEYGVAVQRPSGDETYLSSQRLRVVLDYALDEVSVGFHIDFTTHVYGLVGGVYLAINDRWLEPRRAR